jgi:hypothetical protein
MTDLAPNELVTDIAIGLSKKGVTDLQKAAQAFGPRKKPTPTEKENLAADLANQSDLPDLVTFAGFLGGTLKDAGGNEWYLLYVDWRLSRWLLVPKEDIVYRKAMKDENAPSGERDVLWVRGDASVGEGSGSPSLEARFLTGEFTRAGDFETPPTGGPRAAATGAFCEASSALCCTRRTRG